MYYHSELEHRHIHGDEYKCHYASNAKNQSRFKNIVHLSYAEFQFGCGIVRLILEHAVQRRWIVLSEVKICHKKLRYAEKKKG